MKECAAPPKKPSDIYDTKLDIDALQSKLSQIDPRVMHQRRKTFDLLYWVRLQTLFKISLLIYVLIQMVRTQMYMLEIGIEGVGLAEGDFFWSHVAYIGADKTD